MTRIRQSETWASGAKRTSGPFTGGPPKFLFHATISPANALPGYQSQAVAPHTTMLWDATRNRMTGFQHYYYDQFAKALRNLPGGVQTNMDSALQVELAGYLGSSTPKGQFNILTAPNTYWEQLAEKIGPVILSWGIKNIAPVDWTPKGRFTLSQWDNYNGLCAHVHAPENDHWDLPIPAEALKLLRSKIWTAKPASPIPPLVIPKPVPVPVVPKPPKFPLPVGHAFGPKTGPAWQHSGYYSATDRAGLRMWQAQMRKRGWNITVDGLFGPGTAAVDREFERRQKLRVDGLISLDSWNRAWTAP